MHDPRSGGTVHCKAQSLPSAQPKPKNQNKLICHKNWGKIEGSSLYSRILNWNQYLGTGMGECFSTWCHLINLALTILDFLPNLTLSSFSSMNLVLGTDQSVYVLPCLTLSVLPLDRYFKRDQNLSIHCVWRVHPCPTPIRNKLGIGQWGIGLRNHKEI